jgi:hypothetical protein
MPTETDKREALVAFIESTLEAAQAGVRVESRFRKRRTAQKAERDEVMGDPPYYAEVQREGYRPGESNSPTTGGAPRQPAHEYGVKLYYGYEDADERKASWDALVEGSAGLLLTLRQKESIDDDSGTYHLSQPSDVQEFVTALSNRGPDGELAWYVEFSIVVTHIEPPL